MSNWRHHDYPTMRIKIYSKIIVHKDRPHITDGDTGAIFNFFKTPPIQRLHDLTGWVPHFGAIDFNFVSIIAIAKMMPI